MSPIIISDTQYDFEKLYYVLTQEKYRLFHGEVLDQLDIILESITPTTFSQQLTSGVATFASGNGTFTVYGDLTSVDKTAWNATKIIYAEGGILSSISGSIRFDSNGEISSSSSFTQIEIQTADPLTDLSNYFDQTIVNDIRLDGTVSYLGAHGYAGEFTLLDRVFNDGWSCSIDGSWIFTYQAGDDFEPSSGALNTFTLQENGSTVFQIDITDYALSGYNDDSYQNSYVEQFFAGSDYIIGTSTSNTIIAYAGNDTVESGSGNDLIVGGSGEGDDVYDGGKDIDTVKYTSARASITVDLTNGKATSTAGSDSAGIGNDKLLHIENIIAGNFADTLNGNNFANSIEGGIGDDTINGNLGNDTLVGSFGADTFVFNTKPSIRNIDTIDFSNTDGDKIQLSSKVFSQLKGSANYLATGNHFDSPFQYLIYDSTTGKLSYDVDGSGRKEAIDIAFIGTGLSLSTSDFIII